MIESHTPPPLAAPALYLPAVATALPRLKIPRLARHLRLLGSHPPSAKKVVGYGFEKKKKNPHHKYKSHLKNPQNQNGVHEPEPAPRLGGNFERKSREKLQEASRSILRAQNADRPDRSCCARGGHGGPRLGRQRGSVSFSVSTTSGTSSRSPSRVRNCLFFFFLTSW